MSARGERRARKRGNALARVGFDLSFVALMIAIVAPLLLLGGVTDVGLVAALVVVPCASVVVLLRAPEVRRTRANDIATYALFGVAAFAFLQAVPLPPGVLRVVSPRAHDVWMNLDAFLQRPPSSHPITLDPPATVFMGLTALAVAVFFRAVTAYCREPEARVKLLLGLAIVIVAVDLIAVMHPLLGLTKLFGLYEPRDRGGFDRLPLSPLVNPNHAAALSAIAPPLFVAEALRTKNQGARVFALIGAVVCAATVMLTLSRSGTGIVVAELVALAIYFALQERDRRGRSGRTAIVAGVLVAALIAGLFVVYEPLRGRLEHKSFPKSAVAFHAARVALSFAATGAGRGAFGAVSPAFEEPLRPLVTEHTSFDVRFSHVESWPGQLLVDLGLPAAALYAGALALAFLLAVRGALRRPMGAAAAIALVGLVLHDLVDFSLEFVVMGMVGATLLAVVTVSGPDARTEPRGRFALAAPAALALAAVTTMPWAWGKQADDQARVIAGRWSAGTLHIALDDINRAMALHPTDPYFPMAAGVARFQSLDGGRYLARAVRLGPARAQGHYWLARWFVAAGMRAQGFAEYRAAIRLSPAYVQIVLREMVQLKASLAEIEAVATDERLLEAASHFLSREGRTADAEQLDALLIERHPPAVAARSREIERLIAKGDRDGARAGARALLAVAPTSAEPYLFAARLEDDPRAAIAILDDGLRKAGDDARLLTALIERRNKDEPISALAAELERLNKSIVSRDGTAVAYHAFLGELALARNNRAHAVKHFFDAASASPDGLAHLERAATLAESVGLHQLAADGWRRLSYAKPDEPRYRAALERAEAAAKKPPLHSLP